MGTATIWKVYWTQPPDTLRIILIIITGILATLGNAFWDQFNEPKLFWIPFSVFIMLLMYEVCAKSIKENKIKKYFLTYLLLLSMGNVVKQVFYNEKMRQWNDYVFGSLLTLILLIFLAWEIRKQLYGRK